MNNTKDTHRRNGWTVTVSRTSNDTYAADVTDFTGEPATGFDSIVQHPGILNAREHADEWCDEHPRYTCSVASAFGENGYIAVISRHEHGEVQRLSKRETLDEAAQAGETWIQAKLKQEGEIEDRRRALSLELAPKLQRLIGRHDVLKDERKVLNEQIKAIEKEIRETVAEANSPQIPMDYSDTLRSHRDEAGDKVEDDIEDDAPVADANGKFADGPRGDAAPKRKGRGKGGQRGARKRKGVEVVSETDAAAGEIDTPDDPEKRPGLDPSKVRWTDPEGDQPSA